MLASCLVQILLSVAYNDGAIEGGAMTPSVSEFVRSVSAASRQRSGFTATQTIQGGQLRVEALLRQCGHRYTRVEFDTYQSPLLEMEEALSGQAEFTGDELCSLTIHKHGRTTWVCDMATNLSLIHI